MWESPAPLVPATCRRGVRTRVSFSRGAIGTMRREVQIDYNSDVVIITSWRTMEPKRQNLDAEDRDPTVDLEQATISPIAPNAVEPTEGDEALKSRSQRFHELLDGFDEERIAHLEALAADPNHTRPKVEWRDDPDPFGMDWAWEAPPEARAAASTHPTTGSDSLVDLPMKRTKD